VTIRPSSTEHDLRCAEYAPAACVLLNCAQHRRVHVRKSVTAVRRCRVSVTHAEGVSHVVEVHGASVFEVAATALAQFRGGAWIEALPPSGVLQVEVQRPAVVHQVPLTAVHRWIEGPSVSPKQELLKRPLRRS